MFSKAIVRRPCKNMVKGISTAKFGLPDYEKALIQHNAYIKALEKCGLSVKVLQAEEKFPDSVFVEDTAVLTAKMAIICNPGAISRNDEILKIRNSIELFFEQVEEIKYPGTVDGGDVMQVENHFYVGLSKRTNFEGARQFIYILNKYGFTGSTINLKNVLHLKTGVNYIGNNNLLVSGEFTEMSDFNAFNKISIPPKEGYAANSLRINDFVLVPEGFPKTIESIESLGYKTITINVSEYQKLDGGLSCLSLRF